MREPRILITGRLQAVADILAEELRRYGRDVTGATSHEAIIEALNNNQIDIIVMGAGLPDEEREALVAFIRTVDADIPIHLIQRTPDSNPAKMVPFINEKAVLFKLRKAMDNP